MSKEDLLKQLDDHFDVVLIPEVSPKDTEYNKAYSDRFLADKKTLLSKVASSDEPAKTLEKHLIDTLRSQKKAVDKRESEESAELNAQIDFNQSFISFMEDLKR